MGPRANQRPYSNAKVTILIKFICLHISGGKPANDILLVLNWKYTTKSTCIQTYWHVHTYTPARICINFKYELD